MMIMVGRILGNDLVPRHAKGAQLKALQFILDNEVLPFNVNRVFVLNRIKDEAAAEQLRAILEDRELATITITEDEDAPTGDGIEINYARNKVIDYGLDEFCHWVFPLDGRCYIPEKSYIDMAKQCAAYSERRYAFMPQHRLLSYDEVHDDVSKNMWAFTEQRSDGSRVRTEYALGVSRDAREWYNEDLPYGHCPKAELHTVAGLAGPWVEWCRVEKEAGYPIRDVADDEFSFRYPPQYSGYCLVLPSGNREADEFVDIRAELRQKGVEELKS